MSTEKTTKDHTPTYLHLKDVATMLTNDFGHVFNGNYSAGTQESTRSHCERIWEDAIAHCVSKSGLSATPGHVSAAKRRLRIKRLLDIVEVQAQNRNVA